MTTNYSGDGIALSFTASADMDDYQYRFVKAGSTEGEFAVAAGSEPQALGVLQNDPNTGEAGAIRNAGTTQVYADATGSAIAINDYVTSGSDGQAVKVATKANSFGVALGAVASGSGVLIEVLLSL